MIFLLTTSSDSEYRFMCQYSQIKKTIIFSIRYRNFQSSWDKVLSSHERPTQMANWCFQIFREEVSRSLQAFVRVAPCILG
jgi:hypothetical protein